MVVDGVIAGAGSVLAYMPQILILFFFILILEESGYLPRAAFLLDKLMSKAGLSGRSFIPLLSSFACAIPGVMATRSISSERDRLATIMIAPLNDVFCTTTCICFADRCIHSKQVGLWLAQFTRSSSVRALHVRNRIRFIGFFIPEISQKR